LRAIKNTKAVWGAAALPNVSVATSALALIAQLVVFLR